MKSIDVPMILESDECTPFYGSDEAAGADVKACLDEPLILQSGASALIPTGVKMELPPGYEVQVRPRSGLAAKNAVTVLNTPGTIDSDYRGEIKVILINHGKSSFEVTPGMRIAQLVLAPVYRMNIQNVSELETTARGEGGFGHTGMH